MRRTLGVLACASAVMLTGFLSACGLSGGAGEPAHETHGPDPAPEPITIEEAKAETVRIQEELAALIPDELKSPDALPLPGELPRKPMSCGDDLYAYPGGSAIRLHEGADMHEQVDRLTSHLRELGWSEKNIGSGDRPWLTMQTSPDGYEAIISVLRQSDDLPKITISVWSPCATLPEGVNTYAFEI